MKDQPIKARLQRYGEIFDIYNIFFSDYCQLFMISSLRLVSNQYVARDQWSPHLPLLILENIWNDRCTNSDILSRVYDSIQYNSFLSLIFNLETICDPV